MRAWADAVWAKIEAKMPFATQAAAGEGVIPYQGNGAQWIGPPYDGSAWWTNGFWPALMWQMYHSTGDEQYKTEARRVQALIREQFDRFIALNHDVGFMYLLSFGSDHLLTGDEQAGRDVLHMATVLAGRFNPNGFIRAWNGKGKEGWAIIDCMMNLPILYTATRVLEDPRFEMIAKIHADTSIKYFIREDGSSNHIVIFDPVTGEMLDAPGGQGIAPGSSWSRGQAWALYGFALSYLNTGEMRYKETAMRIADYFVSCIREDGLTDVDFRQPADVDRIDNIAGACAACGLLELSKVADKADAQRYYNAAIKLLKGMDELTADWSTDTCGILQKCTASYHDDGAGRHVNIVYGDYFFVEAICKLRGMDIMPWQPITLEK